MIPHSLAPFCHCKLPPKLLVDILILSAIFFPFPSAHFHLSSIMSFGLNYFIVLLYLLLISFAPLLFCNVPQPTPPLMAARVINAPSSLMVGKRHRLSWSAFGFTVSSSANIIRAYVLSHTQTYFCWLKTHCYI